MKLQLTQYRLTSCNVNLLQVGLLLRGWTCCCRADEAGKQKLTGKQYFLQMDGRTRDEVGCALFVVYPCHLSAKNCNTQVPLSNAETAITDEKTAEVQLMTSCRLMGSGLLTSAMRTSTTAMMVSLQTVCSR